jgi:hypothetical protein
MGIETAALLSYAATAAQVVGAVGAAYGAAQSAKGKPSINIPTPEKPQQATKAADRGGLAAANAAVGGLTGNSGTFLTGPGGVSNSVLNLGKNTLLGQ